MRVSSILKSPWTWLAFHGLLLILFLVHPRLELRTDLFSTLPETRDNPALESALRQSSTKSGAQFQVLVGAVGFEAALGAATDFTRRVRELCPDSPLILEAGNQQYRPFVEYLHQWRFRLLSAPVRQQLQAHQVQGVMEAAWMTISSPLSLGALEFMDDDPFLLTNNALQSFLASGILSGMSVGIRDGVLWTQAQDKDWILLTGQAEVGVDAAAGGAWVIPAINQAAWELVSTAPGVEVLRSGVPFHAWESSTNAQHQIGLVGILAMAALLALMFWAFRSLLPLGVSFLAILLGAGAGLACATLVFGSIHIFTLVFGVSLIGISIDYSFHYFAQRQALLTDGSGALEEIFPGITQGLLTTLLSYGVLTLAPFPLLRELAVFSLAGLISAFLSVICLYPRLPAPRRSLARGALALARGLSGLESRVLGWPRMLRRILALGLGGLVVGGLVQVTMDNNIQLLYRMSDSMKHQEAKVRQILGLKTQGQVFVLEAKNPQELLQREEALGARLASLGIPWLATSLLVPSQQRQQENLDLVATELAPMLPGYLQALGLDGAAGEAMEGDLTASRQIPLEPETFLAQGFSSMVSSLWLGQTQGRWYSMVLVMDQVEAGVLQNLEQADQGIYLVNRVAEVSRKLQQLSLLALGLVALAYLCIAGFYLVKSGVKTMARLLAVPLAGTLGATAVLGWAGLPLNLFAVIALVLGPGIGIDYAIFFHQSRKDTHSTTLAVFLSMVSTLLAFGLLAFTDLAAVFGLTLALVVGICFVASLFCRISWRSFWQGTGGGEVEKPKAGINGASLGPGSGERPATRQSLVRFLLPAGLTLLMVSLLSGLQSCAGSPKENPPADGSLPAREVPKIKAGRKAELGLVDPGLYQGHYSAFQEIQARYQTQTFTMNGVVDIACGSFYVSLLSSFGTQVLEILWKDGKLEVQNLLDTQIQPQYLLWDMQLCYYPLAILKAPLTAAGLELRESTGERQLLEDGQVLVEIRYLDHGLEFHNLLRDYWYRIMDGVQ